MKKKCLVVGGGITGFMAAKLASLNGFEVVVIDSSEIFPHRQPLFNAGLFYSHHLLSQVTEEESFNIFYYSRMGEGRPGAVVYSEKSGRSVAYGTSYADCKFRPEVGYAVDFPLLKGMVEKSPFVTLTRGILRSAGVVGGRHPVFEIRDYLRMPEVWKAHTTIVTIPAPALFKILAEPMLERIRPDGVCSILPSQGLRNPVKWRCESAPILLYQQNSERASIEAALLEPGPFLEVVYNTIETGDINQAYYRSSEFVARPPRPPGRILKSYKMLEFSEPYVEERFHPDIVKALQSQCRRLTPGKITGGGMPEEVVSRLRELNIYLVGRYARWESKWMLHDSYGELLKIFCR